MCVRLMSVLLPAGVKYLWYGVNSAEMTVRFKWLYLCLRSTCDGQFSAQYEATAPAGACEAVLVTDSYWRQWQTWTPGEFWCKCWTYLKDVTVPCTIFRLKDSLTSTARKISFRLPSFQQSVFVVTDVRRYIGRPYLTMKIGLSSGTLRCVVC